VTSSRTPDGYFDRMWGASDDPWAHTSRWYETRKYDLTVACLPRTSYRRAFEAGCGTGLLTERLARRAGTVLATDRHERAVAATAQRCEARPGVEAAVGAIPDDWPDGTFDLVVLSEVLYYLDVPGVRRTVERLGHSLEAGGHIVLVHYRPFVADHALSGDVVHDLVGADPAWRRLVHHDEPDFLLDVHERR
jgi:SAM-dependent methyltransferase